MVAGLSKLFLIVSICLAWSAPGFAQSIQKLQEFKRGKVHELDVAGLNFGNSDLYVVGAVNDARNIRLFVFSGTDRVPRSTIELGRGSSISVSPVSGENRFVTALRDSAGRLKVIGWQVDQNGRNLDRLRDAVGMPIKSVTAASNGFGDLRIVGRLADDRVFATHLSMSESGALEFTPGETYGKAKDLALASGLVGGLAMRISDDTLRVTSLATGGTSRILRGGTLRGGEVSDLDIVLAESLGSFQFVTITSSAYVDTSNVRPGHCVNAPQVVPYYPIGRGKLIAWERETVTSTTLARIAEYQFSGVQGLAHEVAIIPFESTGSGEFVTAHLGYSKPCALKPRAEFHLWELEGGFAKLASTKLGGDYQDLAMTKIRHQGPSGMSRFVAVMRGRVDQLLKITVWEAKSF